MSDEALTREQLLNLIKDLRQRLADDDSGSQQPDLRLRMLAKASFEGIAITDQGILIDANQQLADILGYDLDELIGVPVEQFIYEPDRDLVRQHSQFSFQEPYIHRSVRKDGAIIDVEVWPREISLDGQLLRVTAIRDITERKQAEDALRRRAAQLALLNQVGEQIAAFLELDTLLERSAELVQESFGYHHVAIFLIDPDRKFVHMRGKAGEFTGLFPVDHRLEIGQGVVGWVAQHNRTLLANDVEQEKVYVNLYPNIIITRSELSVPIFLGGEAVGVLDAQSPMPEAFDDLDVLVMETLAGQIAVAIENARLHESLNRELKERRRTESESERRAQQLFALNRMGQAVSSSLDLDLVLSELINAVPPLVQAEGVSILLLENDQELVFAAASGDGAAALTGLRIPAHAGVAGAVIRDRKSYLIGSHVDQDLIYRPIEEQSGYHTQSLLAVPLLLEGEVIGVMEAVHAQSGVFGVDDLQILETAATWAATAIGNARRHTTTQRRLQESQALAAISQALNETLELDRVLSLIVDAAREIMPPVERAVIHLYRPEDEALIPTATSGEGILDNTQFSMRMGQGIAGIVMKQGDPINIPDTHQDERFFSVPNTDYLRSLLVSPVQSGERRLGTLSVSSGQVNAFDDDDERLLTLLAVQAALAIESARLFSETQQRARHMALLNEITRAALQTPDLASLLRMLANRLGQLFGAEICVITLWDETQQVVTPVAVYGQLTDEYRLGEPIQPEKALTREILQAEKPILIQERDRLAHLDPRLSHQYPHNNLLGIPLIAGQHRLGAAVLSFEADRKITALEVNNAESIAQQLALAIYKALLLEAEQIGRQQAEILRRVTASLAATLDLDQVLELILVQLEQAIAYDSAAVFLAERDHLRVVAARGFDDPEDVIGRVFPQDTPLYKEIQARGKPIILADALSDPRWEKWPTGESVRGWMGVPLILQDVVLGYLTVDRYQVGAFGDNQAALAQAFANQAAIAIQNARLFAATNRRLKEVNTLYHISNQIVAAADVQVEEILQQVVNLLWEDFGYYHVHVYLFDQESGALMAQQGSGPVGALLTRQGYQLTADEGIVGYVATLGEAFMSNDVSDVHFYKPIEALPDVSGELAAPLRARDQILGVLDVLYQAPHEFDEDDFRFLTTVADQLAVVLDKALMYNELQAALKKEQSARAQLVQTEKLAAMGRLIASVAHELNNPLQAIQNALFLVKLEENLSPQAREDLQVALGETSRMADLIARLRDTYRPMKIEDFRPVSLNSLVKDVQRLIATHLRHNGVGFTFKPDLALPSVPMIGDQIKQVVLNLSINAIEMMPQGGSLTVRTGVDPQDGAVFVQMQDTGPGIAPEVLPNIFEPFFTTKEGGTGLGLSVSYELIQNHGGRIDVKSEVGQGTRFTVYLPVKRPAPVT